MHKGPLRAFPLLNAGGLQDNLAHGHGSLAFSCSLVATGTGTCEAVLMRGDCKRSDAFLVMCQGRHGFTSRKVPQTFDTRKTKGLSANSWFRRADTGLPDCTIHASCHNLWVRVLTLDVSHGRRMSG